MSRAPEKQVQRFIKQMILDMNGEVDDFSQPRASMQTPGIPDLRAYWRELRVVVWLEVKAGKNKPSPAQHAWLERECLMGHPATVVYSGSDLVWVLEQLGVLEDQGPQPNPHELTVKYIDLWRFAGVDEGAWADTLAEEVGL